MSPVRGRRDVIQRHYVSPTIETIVRQPINPLRIPHVSSPSSDVGVMARYFSSANFSPNGFNFEQWKDDAFDAALATLAESTDPKVIEESYRKAHERLVDNPPWLYIVHDLNPRAMSKKIKGFVSAQSWFLDLTLVSMP